MSETNLMEFLLFLKVQVTFCSVKRTFGTNLMRKFCLYTYMCSKDSDNK